MMTILSGIIYKTLLKSDWFYLLIWFLIFLIGIYPCTLELFFVGPYAYEPKLADLMAGAFAEPTDATGL